MTADSKSDDDILGYDPDRMAKCWEVCHCTFIAWARKLSGSSKRGVGLFSSVLIFHSKVRPPYMLYT